MTSPAPSDQMSIVSLSCPSYVDRPTDISSSPDPSSAPPSAGKDKTTTYYDVRVELTYTEWVEWLCLMAYVRAEAAGERGGAGDGLVRKLCGLLADANAAGGGVDHWGDAGGKLMRAVMQELGRE